MGDIPGAAEGVSLSDFRDHADSIGKSIAGVAGSAGGFELVESFAEIVNFSTEFPGRQEVA